MDGGNDAPRLETQLTWANVGLGFTFIMFDALVSQFFGLGVGVPLVTAAIRCVVQLTFMSLVLQKIFDADSMVGIFAIAVLLNLMGTIEVVVNKAKMRFEHMWPIIFVCMLFSTIPVSILGAAYAMDVSPFWTSDQFIPIVGMLCGNTISATVITLNFILKEISDNRDKVETYLAFGASRLEACRPVAVEALRLALTTPISQLSVLGIISIPGMMTGAILGGASVQQAARLQMIIMFMIAAATALAAISVAILCLLVVTDASHRIRSERIDGRKHAIWRMRKRAWEWGVGKADGEWESVRRRLRVSRGNQNRGASAEENGEGLRLLP